MSKIYIGLVSTPGLFASIIRRTIKQDYIHVVLGLDAELNEAYSIGRRNPWIPIISGFEKEEKGKILSKFPEARYQIFELECTAEQRSMIEQRLKEDWERRFRMHYTIIGLPWLLLNKPFYQKNHYTCSSYLAKVLEDVGINLFDNKHFSLVTPKDFYEYENKKVIYEGSLRNITDREEIGLIWRLYRKAYINER